MTEREKMLAELSVFHSLATEFSDLVPMLPQTAEVRLLGRKMAKAMRDRWHFTGRASPSAYKKGD